ncbi:hypothetical protein CR513_34559, partial [Mucuna pruriens]
MKDNKSVKEYTSKLPHLVVGEKMLISLLIKFEAKVVAIEESCDLKKLTIFKWLENYKIINKYFL